MYLRNCSTCKGVNKIWLALKVKKHRGIISYWFQTKHMLKNCRAPLMNGGKIQIKFILAQVLSIYLVLLSEKKFKLFKLIKISNWHWFLYFFFELVQPTVQVQAIVQVEFHCAMFCCTASSSSLTNEGRHMERGYILLNSNCELANSTTAKPNIWNGLEREKIWFEFCYHSWVALYNLKRAGENKCATFFKIR